MSAANFSRKACHVAGCKGLSLMAKAETTEGTEWSAFRDRVILSVLKMSECTQQIKAEGKVS